MKLTQYIAKFDAVFGSSQPIHAANTLANLAERSMGRNTLRSMPITVQVEVTSRCNLNCMMCSRSSTPFKGQDMQDDVLDAVVDLARKSREMVLFGYGEPLICSAFDRVIQLARSARVSFVTNGLRLDTMRAADIMAVSKRRIQTISFSIDSPDPHIYEAIRERSDFARVWGNLEDLAQMTQGSGHPKVWIDFVAMRRNIEGLPELIEKAARAGVERVNVFNLAVWDESYANESLIYHTELARDLFEQARAVALQHGIHVDLPVVPDLNCKNPTAPEPCADPWSFAYIRQDGTVQACCFADEFAMGNVRDEPFSKIWNGGKYQALRAQVNSLAPPEPCLRCEQRWRTSNSPDDASVYLKLKPRSRADGA